MESGTYAVDPEPSGPPWRQCSEIGVDEAEARVVLAPVPALSFGAPGAIVAAPGDTRGTVLIPERCDGYCMGLDGRDGPNLACAPCGRAVATRIDDWSSWQAVWFDPQAVCRLPADLWGQMQNDRCGQLPAGAVTLQRVEVGLVGADEALVEFFGGTRHADQRDGSFAAACLRRTGRALLSLDRRALSGHVRR